MAFNLYQGMPFIPYKIIQYLALNNENIWKILKYDDYDCLSKPNLTLAEKMDLVWNRQGNQEDYNVFFTQLVENSILESTTILKIYKIITTPRDSIHGVAGYEFDILYGGKIALIDYDGIPCNRGDVMESEILQTLNGADVGGVGLLQFNAKLTSMSRSNLNLGNSKTFTGTSLIMGVELIDVGGDGESCQ